MSDIVQEANRRTVFFSRALEACWLAFIFLVPLFFNPLSHQSYYLNKALLLQFLTCLMLAFAVAGWLYNRSGRQRLNWRRFTKDRLRLSVLVFGLLAAVATITSVTPSTSFWGSWQRGDGLLTLLCWIIFFLLVAYNLRSRRQLLRAVYTLLLSAALVSLLGILQYYFPEAMQHFFHTAISQRVSSTTGNALSLSALLAMTIPFNLALIAYNWSRRQPGSGRIILTALIMLLVLQIWCLALAQYSVTVLLFVIGAVVFITLLGVVKRNRYILGLGVMCLLALVIVAASIIVPLLLPGSDAGDLESKDLSTELSPGELLGISLGGYRVEYWKSAAEIVFTTPEIPFANDSINPLRTFIGYGPETFIITFQSVFPEELKSLYTQYSSMVDRPHNHYLYLATTLGLLGLAAFLELLAFFFYYSWRHLRRAKLDIDKLLLIAAAAAMLQYMADSLFNPSTLSAGLVFWIILAMVPVIGRLVSADEAVEEETTEPNKAREIGPSSVKARVCLSVMCAILLIAGGVGLTINPLLADIQLQKGLNLQAEQDPNAVWAFSKATEIQPQQAAYWGNLGGYVYLIALNSSAGESQTELLEYSTESYEKARQLEPYLAYRYYILADEYVYWAQQGAGDKWQMAFDLYQQALRLIPENAVIINKWALALIIKGNYEQAQAKLDYAAAIDPGWVETSFLHGLLLVEEGGGGAAPEILALVEDNPVNLWGFRRLCSNLIIYDMVQPLDDALENYMQGAPEEWIAHAMLGVTDFYVDGAAASLQEFDAAMSLVPDKYIRVLFETTLDFADISHNFRTQLADTATGWRSKLSQSPDSESLLLELDVLLGE